jgi:LPXTG-motif cell wall-anchored protein
MKTRQIAGIALIVVGLALLIAGMDASDSFADRASNFFTGHYTDNTMWYLIGGLVIAGTGVVLLLSRRLS